MNSRGRPKLEEPLDSKYTIRMEYESLVVFLLNYNGVMTDSLERRIKHLNDILNNEKTT